MGDLLNQEDGCQNCTGFPNIRRRPQEGSVPDSKSRYIAEVVFVRRWAVGALGIWKGWDSWVKGGEMGSVYKQPETEVDDSCHSWRVPSK